MHRNAGLDWTQDVLRVATVQSGFRGFAIQDVRSVPLPAEGTPAERLQAGLIALELHPSLGRDDFLALALPGAPAASHLLTVPFADSKPIRQVLPAAAASDIP